MNQKMLNALASSIYVSRLSIRGETVDDDDKRIRASGLYDEWVPGSHAAGEIYNAADQTWECYQGYDNATHPDIVPGDKAWFTFNRPLHGRAPETARPWVAPTHAEDIYRYGEYMIWTDGNIYHCVALTGTDFSPADFPEGWEIHSTT